MEFQDKVVLITGAAGGIGQVTAKMFAEEGAKLVLVDLKPDLLDQLSESLSLHADNYLMVASDVTNESDVENYVQQAIDKFGWIDVFFNNAGIEGEVAPITEYPTDVMASVVDVNIKGTFYGIKHVLKVMQEQESGAVINTSSVAGLTGSADVSPYIISKHAIVGLTRATAVESAPYNVRVNAVCPAPANTRMMRSLESGYSPDDAEAAKADLEKSIPLGRYSEAEDIANLVLFLASDKASFITGGIYPVDGGLTTT